MKKNILAIGAHPDDIEIGCGGTLVGLRDLGYRIFYLIVTSGEEGSLSATKTLTTERRELEAQRAAEVLGASSVLFLREPDGLTFYTKECKSKIVSVIRELKPEMIFTHAASDHFPDHQIVHQLTLAAVTAAGGPWHPACGGEPHRVGQILGYEVWNPISKYQVAVDVTATFEKKVKALREHQSQIQDIDYISAVQGLARFRAVMSGTGHLAEVFEILKGRISVS